MKINSRNLARGLLLSVATAALGVTAFAATDGAGLHVTVLSECQPAPRYRTWLRLLDASHMLRATDRSV